MTVRFLSILVLLTSARIPLPGGQSQNSPQFAGSAAGHYRQLITTSGIAITIGSTPGTLFQVDGHTYAAQQTFSWQPGSIHLLGVPTPQGPSDGRFLFTYSSDGGHGLKPLAPPPMPH